MERMFDHWECAACAVTCGDSNEPAEEYTDYLRPVTREREEQNAQTRIDASMPDVECAQEEVEHSKKLSFLERTADRWT